MSAERAIVTRDEDKLERSPFVDRFVDAIVDPITRRSTGVVVGITGPWGSGKTSVLNLLEERISSLYRHALIVRFDPWLITGSDELIESFIKEFLASLNYKSSEYSEWSEVADALSEYAEAFSPVVREVNGIAGSLLAFFQWVLGRRGTRKTLPQLRAELSSRLREVNAPVVVLIDELDRVEDDEVKAVAQLVRAVIDFPNVSYVLAYDHGRVVEALGTLKGRSPLDAPARGQAYLEKIVQFAFPLPLTESNDLKVYFLGALDELIAAGVDLDLQAEGGRGRAVVDALLDGVLVTPRDAKRVLGHYRVLNQMVGGEVNGSDLLGYSALATKCPQVLEIIAGDYERYVDDPADESEYLRRVASKVDRFEPLRPVLGDRFKRLFGLLFPQSRRDRTDDLRYSLPISRRHALRTVLKLGISTEGIRRDEIEYMLGAPANQVARFFKDRLRDGTLFPYLDRIQDIYPTVSSPPPMEFWRGVRSFLQKRDRRSALDLLAKREAVESFARMLITSAYRRSAGSEAVAIVSAMGASGEINVTAEILRLHFFMHGLFERRKDSDRYAFLDEDETKSLARSMASKWKKLLVTRGLVYRIVNMDVIYVLRDMDQYGPEERSALTDQISNMEIMDRMTVLMFGRGHMVHNDYLDTIVDRDKYLSQAIERLAILSDEVALVRASANQLSEHNALRTAYERAVGGFTGSD